MGNKNQHSVLGASSSHRWLACPGSVRLTADIPPTSSKYADEGTAAHELAELCLKTDQNAADRIGTIITANGTPFTVTEEMADAVQVYVDTVRQDYEVAGATADMRLEQQFNLDWLYPGMFGRNDAMVGDEAFGILKVYDYKHGAGVLVEVENNPQLMYYGLGALKGSGYDEVELVVVQPRAPHPKGSVRRWTISADDLMKWGEEVLLPGAKATEDPEAPLIAGEHCQFCAALPTCPAQKTYAMSIVPTVFDETPSAPPSPDVLTPVELRKILNAADLIESWLKACREHVHALLESGRIDVEEIGYKLVAGRASRSWLDEQKAKEWLEAMLDEEAYTKPSLVSPAQAEKLLKGATAKQAIKGMVQETRGKQLAPISDPREALPPTADLVFGEFKEN